MKPSQIREFYTSYKNQILDEMQEYLDMPLSNIKKGKTQYEVYEDGIKALYNFRLSFPISNQYFDVTNDTKAWTVNWGWYEMQNQNKTPQNFLRVLASGYQVLADFINRNTPDLITFSGLTKGHENLYTGTTFLKRLKTLFGKEYDIIPDKENSVVYIINKAISKLKQEAIAKRAQQTGIVEAVTYWTYPHLHPDTPWNVKVKQVVKKRVLEELYYKELEVKR